MEKNNDCKKWLAKTDKTLLYAGSEVLKSQHAGYTDDELYVPLIVVNKSQ